MEADSCANVGMLGNEVHHGAHFGFAGGVRAGAYLLMFLTPESREVAIQIQAFNVSIGFDVDAVVMLQTAFGHHSVIFATKLTRQARCEQPWLIWIGFPTAMGIWNAHHQNATVAIHVFNGQAFNVGLVPWVGPSRRSNVPRFVCQGQFCAIWIQTGHQVNDTRVEQFCDASVFTVFA